MSTFPCRWRCAAVMSCSQLDDGALELFELNDQHAYVRVPPGFDLAVGDIVGCGISHPCTTFDRWRALPLVDEHCNVAGVVRTFF